MIRSLWIEVGRRGPDLRRVENVWELVNDGAGTRMLEVVEHKVTAVDPHHISCGRTRRELLRFYKEFIVRVTFRHIEPLRR